MAALMWDTYCNSLVEHTNDNTPSISVSNIRPVAMHVQQKDFKQLFWATVLLTIIAEPAVK